MPFKHSCLTLQNLQLGGDAQGHLALGGLELQQVQEVQQGVGGDLELVDDQLGAMNLEGNEERILVSG